MPGVGQHATDRNTAEAEIADWLRFETLLAEIASGFVHVSAEQIDDEINHALRRVCEPLGLELGTVWTSLAEPESIRLTHFYASAGTPPPVLRLKGLELFPWCFGKVTAGEVVAVASVEELPPEAARDRENWRQFGIKSNLTFGLAVGGKATVGALSFNTLQAEHSWPEPLVMRLKLLAQMFSSVLARQRTDIALRESEERFRSLVENSTVGIYRTTPDGRILMANPTLIKMLGYPDFESLASRNLEREGFEPTYSRNDFRERVEKTGQVIGLEAAWRKSDGSVVFMRESTRAIRGEDGTVRWYDGIVEDVTARKRAEQALQRQAGFDEMMTRVLHRFVTCRPPEVDAAAVKALEDIAGLIGSDHAYIIRASADLSSWSMTHEWCGPGVRAQIPEFQNTPMGTMPRNEQLILGGEIIRINTPDEYPLDALRERRIQREEGNLSELTVPLRDPEGILSCIGLHSHARPVTWADEDVAHLQMIGDAAVTALERKRAQDELENSMQALGQRAAFDKLVSDMLASFAVSPLPELDETVERALGSTAEFIGADHAFVIGIAPDLASWGFTHEWCGPNVTPGRTQFQNVPMGTNPEIERLILSGQVIRINAPDDIPPHFGAERRHQANEGFLSELEIPMRSKRGILANIGLHCHARSRVWSDEDIAHLRVVADGVVNVLDRKSVIEELQASERKFSAAFRASPASMTILSLATGRYIEVNKALEDTTGLRAEEVIGRTPQEVAAELSVVWPAELSQTPTVHGSFRNVEVQYRAKTGELRTGLLSAELIEFGGELCSLRVMEDITERKRVEEATREIGKRMMMAQEDERRRLARELHDDFSQRLALLAIDLEQLVKRSPASTEEWITQVRALAAQTQELTVDIHHVSHQLHPSKLEELGLVTALRGYCREFSKQAGLDVRFSGTGVPRTLPKEISLCIYRIAQEALRNVAKHSGAKSATVDLSAASTEICLTVSDAGSGFALEACRENRGLGLVSMQERVRYVGGVWSLDSRPDGGTRVMVRIPLPSGQEVSGTPQSPRESG